MTRIKPEEGARGFRRSRSITNTYRLRVHRLAVGETMKDAVIATATHPGLESFTASVVDVSLDGLRLSVSDRGSEARLVTMGDRLEALTLHCGSEVLYHGSGTVVRSLEREGALELGVQVQDGSIEIERLYWAATRATVRDRWKQNHEAAHFDHVSAEFKSWVSDIAAYLKRASDFLDEEERKVENLDLHTRVAVLDELLDTAGPDIVARMNRAGLELGPLVSSLSKDEHADYRGFARMHLQHSFECSPFMRRAQRKPLGYAGDYEMMNMLYRDHAEGSSVFGKCLNMYATQQPVSRANINRLEFLGRKITAAVKGKSRGRVRVASIGCGPAQEVHELLSKRPELGPRLDIALIDQEPQAITHCERSLAPLVVRTGVKIRPIRESARRLLVEGSLSESIGSCDLIYSAGLFDYLADRSFIALLGVLYGALAPGGMMTIGNVAVNNPDRWAMEYFVDWFLNHRSKEQLLECGRQLRPSPADVQVEAEPLGVNLFLTIER